jgi:hypothetical protein
MVVETNNNHLLKEVQVKIQEEMKVLFHLATIITSKIKQTID